MFNKDKKIPSEVSQASVDEAKLLEQMCKPCKIMYNDIVYDSRIMYAHEIWRNCYLPFTRITEYAFYKGYMKALKDNEKARSECRIIGRIIIDDYEANVLSHGK